MDRIGQVILMYQCICVIVWWMRPIYKPFFATPCKHPNFWGVNREWCTSKKLYLSAARILPENMTREGSKALQMFSW